MIGDAPSYAAIDLDLRTRVSQSHLADEQACLRDLYAAAALDHPLSGRVQDTARELVEAMRATPADTHLDALLHEYDLTTREGVLLLCLAEALLRIPDAATQDRIIRDKLTPAAWERHLGPSRSWFVNASTWSLMLGQRIAAFGEEGEDIALYERLLARLGEPVLRAALRQGIGILAHEFVMAPTIEEALSLSRRGDAAHDLYSFDMLGESALCGEDVETYFRAYHHAITILGTDVARPKDLFDRPGISVKLTALHPRFEYLQRERVMRQLVPPLTELVHAAMETGVAVTIDAEEAERLDLTLDVFASVLSDARLAAWGGLGMAVQAYQKRAPAVIEWLIATARAHGTRIPIRLVKGAYWDTEIKRAQVQGIEGYPVFTRKAATDVSYLACARQVLAARDALYPQFATHNAHTVAYVLNLADDMDGNLGDMEFQRLHGMGEALYDALRAKRPETRCRVYAPVGSYRDLLPYLVRRLLENGANTSFINRMRDRDAPVEEAIGDPTEKIRQVQFSPNPRIPLPRNLFGTERRNSDGLNLADASTVAQLQDHLRQSTSLSWNATPSVTAPIDGEAHPTTDPADSRRITGYVVKADARTVTLAMDRASQAAIEWDRVPAGERAAILGRAADLIEQHRFDLIALCVREGGRTAVDAIAEIREAVDYCRYYGHLAHTQFAAAIELPGPNGESNQLSLRGKGVFACISPWNFPIAIFTGQVAAALAAGNAVVAKPASATPLAAAKVVELLHEAGVPDSVLHFLPGDSAVIAPPLLRHPALSGVAFTGSSDSARTIARELAQREGPIIPFIAETGGMNAMIVDSSALPQQVVTDVLQSAFNSAGQRCSALRILFLQEEVAAPVIRLLQGAMDELTIGDPLDLATDIGPLIERTAQSNIAAHVERLRKEAALVHAVNLPDGTEYGSFFAPHLFELRDLGLLHGEVFGPVLHIVRYRQDHLDRVVDAINNTGYGLTLGIQSRIDETVQRIVQRARVGNIYVNRNMIGAVVGVQPFGGEGLSGTGPKAGGPHYLLRFASERSVAINTAAVGGNIALLSGSE